MGMGATKINTGSGFSPPIRSAAVQLPYNAHVSRNELVETLRGSVRFGDPETMSLLRWRPFVCIERQTSFHEFCFRASHG
jgi:hypothetical protein